MDVGSGGRLRAKAWTAMQAILLCVPLVALSCGGYRPGPPLSETERRAYALDTGLAAIIVDMTTKDVTDRLGAPTSYQTGLTGQSWIPGYAGGGTHLTVYRYRGRGRVWFTNPGWFRLHRVIRVEPDPEERG
jgi:hypothetical protein